jgi:pilus assembly protein CpaC
MSMRKWILLFLISVAVPGVIFAQDASAVRLLVGRSTIVDVGSAIARVSLTSADVADAMVTSANQLLVNGKMPGTISMFVWERSGGLRRYEVVVQRDLARLNDQMKQLFPGETIDAQSSGKGIVLSGSVSSSYVSDKAMTVAGGYVEKADEVVSLLRVQESTASNQVLLRVRFAEVSRSAITDLGASLFTGAGGYKNYVGRTTTQQFPAPIFDSSEPGREKLVFSDFLNLFLFNTEHQLGTVIKALQSKGQFQSLAEPNLVAESGKEASFLAGGEFPVPIAQGTGGNVAISVQYKEFGVRLNFTPVIHGDRVHLKVRPEVSTLDFANGVMLQGFRIPALSTRRTETELELQDGQTFAIAGLLNNSVNSTLQKIPGIGDIPILGLLFKSKAAQKDQTELVVMITPQILPRNSPGVTASLPRTPEPYLAPPPAKKMVDSPPPAFTPARSGNDVSPAAAAAIVRGLTAPPPRVVVQSNAAPPPSDPVAPAVPASPEAAAPLTSPNVVPAAEVSRPLTAQEKQMLDRAHKQEEAAKAAEAKARMKQAEIDRRALQAEQAEQARFDREQAKRNAADTKKAAEAAKKQAEIDRQVQKAEASAQAELAKQQK